MAEESSDGRQAQGSPHAYPQSGANATPAFDEDSNALTQKIIALISAHGPMSFRDYMALALYDREHGYYNSRSKRVGKEGDFITSVSVGRCFGIILARRIHAGWLEMGKPQEFHLIEPGAHDGALCTDILTEIQSHAPEFYQAITYHPVEISPRLRELHKHQVGDLFPGKVDSHASLSELKGLTGAILSNELLDANPVHLVRYQDGRWWQLFVCTHDGRLGFLNGEIASAELRDFCDQLGNAFPDGYTTEFNPGIAQFAHDAGQALDRGIFITIDYGHEAIDYYHPGRTEGTLQTYHKHHKLATPLTCPGEIDITSHVDFTRLMQCAESEGFENAALKTQSSYLTQHAREWLMELENKEHGDTLALARQFQSLTHPSMLGAKFLVLEMNKRKKTNQAQ